MEFFGENILSMKNGRLIILEKGEHSNKIYFNIRFIYGNGFRGSRKRISADTGCLKGSYIGQKITSLWRWELHRRL